MLRILPEEHIILTELLQIEGAFNEFYRQSAVSAVPSVDLKEGFGGKLTQLILVSDDIDLLLENIITISPVGLLRQ